METIKASNYSVCFEEIGYYNLNTLIENNQYSSIFILTDTNTCTLCYPIFIQLLVTKLRIELIQINAGEINKNLETCTGVWEAMTALDADRGSLLINLGGGMVTDMGGFIASCFKRGIDFVNIPTSLLAMVDASIGGKTGVDLNGLKNQIGLFSTPKLVIIDPLYLQTLPAREIRSGTAEIIKKALTHDRNIYEAICNENSPNIVDFIHRSISIKNDIVKSDPYEKGLRKVLNFGHTIGHAVETYFLTNETKETLTHGEAIVIGMICESYISHKMLNITISEVNNIKINLVKIFGKVIILKKDFAAIINLLKHDKKNTNAQVNFVLLNAIEDFKIDCSVPPKFIEESLLFYTK